LKALELKDEIIVKEGQVKEFVYNSTTPQISNVLENQDYEFGPGFQ